MAYSVLSKFYDTVILDSEYERWTDYVISVVKNNVKGVTGLDVGCGSGIVTLKLKKAGFKVTGVDISEEMLLKAGQRAINQNLNVDFIRQDMKSLKFFEKVSFITVINDGLNYLKQADLVKTFKSFYKCLSPNGTLIFDISSSYKLKTVLGNNMYGDNSENLSYMWFNTLNEDSVDLSVTFFEKQGDTYVRHDEVQTQYIHDMQAVITALSAAGFKLVSVTGAYGEEVTPTTERLMFIANKN